jgi:hypothetical protein
MIRKYVMSRLNVHAARCEALFASGLQESQHPAPEEVQAAIQQEIRRHGVRQCLARVAHEFGEHPEIAVIRMRWAKQMVSWAYGSPASQPSPPPLVAQAAQPESALPVAR